jgi:hypothetical protein
MTPRAARLERFEGPVGRFRPALHPEVRAGGAQRVENGVGAAVELAQRDRRAHRRGDDARRQHFVEPSDRRHLGVAQVEHRAA